MSTSNGVAPQAVWPANALGALFDFAVGSHRRAVCVLLLASLIAFVPGLFGIPPIDRDESRFAQASKQMIETGDYVDIRFQTEVRYKKPVGIYWLQAAAVKTAEALGVSHARGKIWLYRLPSLIGAVGSVLATYWCAIVFLSRRGAMLAALMMMASPLLGIEARMATTDGMLLLTVTVAMGVLARFYMVEAEWSVARSWALAAAFWTALACGVLLKGPIIIIFVGLTIAALWAVDRSGSWLMRLRPLLGIPWLILLVLPWFIAIYVRAGNTFFVDSAGHDLFSKIASGQEGHGGPPGLYLVLFFATFFPASLFASLSVPAIWEARRGRGTRFLLAWLVPSWIVFELVMTKLPHYVMPLFPAIAILIAGVVESDALSRNRKLVSGLVLWFVVPIVISVAVIVGAIIIDRELMLPAWPFFAAAIFCGLLAWRLYADGAERALLRATAAAVFMAIGIYGICAPAFSPLFPSRALAGVMRQADCADPVAASVGYEEPSLVFLVGTATHLTDAAGAADFLKPGGCRYAFVESRRIAAFAQRAEAIGLRYDRGPRVEAFNVSNGQRVTIAVFRSAETTP